MARVLPSLSELLSQLSLSRSWYERSGVGKWIKEEKKEKNAKNEVAANNMFEALANENEDDMEFIVPTKPEVVFRTFFGRSSVGNRYGSRKNVTLVERYEKRKRIHGCAS